MNLTQREEILIHTMALSLLEGIGPITAKKLIAFCGGPQLVFEEKEKHLRNIPGIGGITASTVKKSAVAFMRAEQEMKWIDSNNVQAVTFLDDLYPRRLKYCEDGPLVLFCRGDFRFNHQRMLAVVGTRHPTEYGKNICEEIVAQLAAHDVTIVSGMAYGIDIIAHRTSVKNEMETIGVLAHGLDRMYPQVHQATGRKMEKKGGLVTEFMTGTEPDHQNFPKRNRIVAGMCDATLVIETAVKGGSMITAELANDYSRDVFAIPGAVGQELSRGCNFLIRTHRAQLAEGADEILRVMGWQQTVLSQKPVLQKELFNELDERERLICRLLQEKGKTMIDHISLETEMPVSQAGVHLLNLEFKGLVRSLPGKIYELC